ncbi:MAG: MASE1 domain-containing protein, partial [Thiobacillaceae bacterium]
MIVARPLLLALAYFATGWLGLRIPYVGSHITLVWLPTGIAVAALFRWGWKLWPGVYLGALLVNVSIGSSWPLAAGIAVGNTLSPLLTVAWLKRVGFHPAFDRREDVASFIAAACLGMTVSASGGVANLYLAGLLPMESAGSAWLTWWMGDTVGVLLSAPLLLTLSWKNIEQLSRAHRESLLWILVAGTVAWLAFIHDYGQAGRSLPLAFMTLPLLAWAALRLGTTATTIAGLGFSVVAAWGTATGHGTFNLHDAHISLFLLWSYMAITVLTGLLIIALQAERLQVERTLRESEDRFRTLFEGAPVGQLLIEPGSLRVLECNQAAADIHGYSREELCRLRVWDFNVGLSSEAVLAVEQCLLANEQVQFETQVRRKTGELRDLSVNVVTLHSAKGNRISATHVDITERKGAETLMHWDREQQTALRGLLEGVLKDGGLDEILDDCLKNLLAVSWLSILP